MLRRASQRARILEQLETFTDARVERYWQLLAVVNGQTPPPAAVPAFDWLIVALRADPQPAKHPKHRRRPERLTGRSGPTPAVEAPQAPQTPGAPDRPRRHNNGVNEPEISVRPVNEGDRPMLAWLVAELWGSEIVAVHGTSLRPAELAGFIAERSGRLAGLLTYQLLGDEVMEIVTLNAIDRRVGIGTLLIESAVSKARRFGCREIRLTTTNDNVDALRFYQRRGFRLAELRPGAVDRARQHKPEIPRVGDYGIPLRDEIDLMLPV